MSLFVVIFLSLKSALFKINIQHYCFLKKFAWYIILHSFTFNLPTSFIWSEFFVDHISVDNFSSHCQSVPLIGVCMCMCIFQVIIDIWGLNLAFYNLSCLCFSFCFSCLTFLWLTWTFFPLELYIDLFIVFIYIFLYSFLSSCYRYYNIFVYM